MAEPAAALWTLVWRVLQALAAAWLLALPARWSSSEMVRRRCCVQRLRGCSAPAQRTLCIRRDVLTPRCAALASQNKLNKAQKEAVKNFASVTESTCVACGRGARGVHALLEGSRAALPRPAPRARRLRSDKIALEILKSADWDTDVRCSCRGRRAAARAC